MLLRVASLALLFVALSGSLVACSSDTTSAGGVAPSGVFSRTQSDPDGTTVINLAFTSGKGARFADKNGVTERTCFAYEPSATGVKATLKSKVVSNKGASTTQDLSGRIVDGAVTMSADGSKLDSAAFLEDGRWEYPRDSATSAADVLKGCP